MDPFTEQLRKARTEGGVIPIPPRVIIRVSGSDAFRYLNGQLTRDLGRFNGSEALHACLLNPKGRLCASLLVHCEGEDWILEADEVIGDALVERLERYIVADDVTLAVEPDPGGWHLFGDIAMTTPWKDLSGKRCRRLGVPGMDLEASKGNSRHALPPVLDPLVGEILRIERGIPSWGNELSTDTLPPEAGLDRTHIDYDRGCYPGQEVISRLKSIGRVNRSLHVVSSSQGSVLLRGMVVESGAGVAGELTSVAGYPASGLHVALAYLNRGAEPPLFALDPLTGAKTAISILQSSGS